MSPRATKRRRAKNKGRLFNHHPVELASDLSCSDAAPVRADSPGDERLGSEQLNSGNLNAAGFNDGQLPSGTLGAASSSVATGVAAAASVESDEADGNSTAAESVAVPKGQVPASASGPTSGLTVSSSATSSSAMVAVASSATGTADGKERLLPPRPDAVPLSGERAKSRQPLRSLQGSGSRQTAAGALAKAHDVSAVDVSEPESTAFESTAHQVIESGGATAVWQGVSVESELPTDGAEPAFEEATAEGSSGVDPSEASPAEASPAEASPAEASPAEAGVTIAPCVELNAPSTFQAESSDGSESLHHADEELEVDEELDSDAYVEVDDELIGSPEQLVDAPPSEFDSEPVDVVGPTHSKAQTTGPLVSRESDAAPSGLDSSEARPLSSAIRSHRRRRAAAQSNAPEPVEERDSTTPTAFETQTPTRQFSAKHHLQAPADTVAHQEPDNVTEPKRLTRNGTLQSAQAPTQESAERPSGHRQAVAVPISRAKPTAGEGGNTSSAALVTVPGGAAATSPVVGVEASGPRAAKRAADSGRKLTPQESRAALFAQVRRAVRLDRAGNVLWSREESEEFTSLAAYASRLVELIGKNLGVGNFQSFECDLGARRILVCKESEEAIITLELPPEADLPALRDCLCKVGQGPAAPSP